MLHATVAESAFTALPADVQKEYTKGTDGNYVLQTDIDVAGLNKQIGDKQTALEAANTKYATLETEYGNYKKANKGNVDVDKLTADAKAAALADVQPRLDRGDKLEGYLQKTLAETTAKEIARAVGGEKNEFALLPHVSKHLKVNMDGDTPKVVILDKDGKESTQTADDLAKRLREDKHLANLVVISRASGSGGAGRTTPTPTQQTGNVSLANMKPAELAKHLASRK